MEDGTYKFNSCGTVYEIEYKKTSERNHETRKWKHEHSYWATCIEYSVRETPCLTFKIGKDKISDWEKLLDLGYISRIK